MDEAVRLRMRRAHAKYPAFCSCGKVVHGNGGRYNHREMHRAAEDGHHYIGETVFYNRFPDWTPHNNKRRIKGPLLDSERRSPSAEREAFLKKFAPHR